MQKWKIDSSLHSCERKAGKKVLDYHTYVKEFLDSDPIRDWESIERCKDLWFWSLKLIPGSLSEERKILDVGTKDGQFPEFLQLDGFKNSIGIEISQDYISYARNDKNRPVIYGDVCNLPEEWTDRYDYVFSHHVLGLTSDYQKALDEMYRVTKPGGNMITLNQCPGNEKKHYSYIDSPQIFYQFIENNQCSVLYNDYLDTGFEKEWVFFIKKNELNNRCIKCGKVFYWWFHGQGMVCSECQEAENV